MMAGPEERLRSGEWKPVLKITQVLNGVTENVRVVAKLLKKIGRRVGI